MPNSELHCRLTITKATRAEHEPSGKRYVEEMLVEFTRCASIRV